MILSRTRSSDDLGISLKQSSALFIHTDLHLSAVYLLRESRSVRLADTTLHVLRYARIALAAEVLQQTICTIKIRCTPNLNCTNKRHDNLDFGPLIFQN